MCISHYLADQRTNVNHHFHFLNVNERCLAWTAPAVAAYFISYLLVVALVLVNVVIAVMVDANAKASMERQREMMLNAAPREEFQNRPFLSLMR